jgi:hypothetical protein
MMADRVREHGTTEVPSSAELADRDHPREVHARAVAAEVARMSPEWRAAYLDSKRPPMPAKGSREWSEMMAAREAAGDAVEEEVSWRTWRDRMRMPAGSQNPDG